MKVTLRISEQIARECLKRLVAEHAHYYGLACGHGNGNGLQIEGHTPFFGNTYAESNSERDKMLEALSDEQASIPSNFGWVRCSGTSAMFKYDGEEWSLTFNGARHSIVELRYMLFEENGDHESFKAFEVVEYQTTELTWKWWETKDNYRKENQDV